MQRPRESLTRYPSRAPGGLRLSGCRWNAGGLAGSQRFLEGRRPSKAAQKAASPPAHPSSRLLYKPKRRRRSPTARCGPPGSLQPGRGRLGARPGCRRGPGQGTGRGGSAEPSPAGGAPGERRGSSPPRSSGTGSRQRGPRRGSHRCHGPPRRPGHGAPAGPVAAAAAQAPPRRAGSATRPGEAVGPLGRGPAEEEAAGPRGRRRPNGRRGARPPPRRPYPQDVVALGAPAGDLDALRGAHGWGRAAAAALLPAQSPTHRGRGTPSRPAREGRAKAARGACREAAPQRPLPGSARRRQEAEAVRWPPRDRAGPLSSRGGGGATAAATDHGLPARLWRGGAP